MSVTAGGQCWLPTAKFVRVGFKKADIESWVSQFLTPRNGGGGDAADLRASDADRERVIGVLTDAAADGRLTLIEHQERMEAAAGARTLSELAVLTADLLPPDAQPIRVDSAPVTALFRKEHKSGRWVVPSEIPIASLGGQVTMDLSEAVLRTGRITVRLSVMAGTVILIVPEGVRVERAPSARIRTFRNDVPAAPDGPVIELAGFAYGGKVIARLPKRPGRFRRNRRQS
ncbi:DUF1707 domain-containing protein [Streptosporangiaceae bacterium NEAU-GS5]|nr:DUF1707 domain-containing protein [Streptosporangiaceae bacterium NEAU-GS5]